MSYYIKEGPTWQETEGGLQPSSQQELKALSLTTLIELSPDKNHMSEHSEGHRRPGKLLDCRLLETQRQRDPAKPVQVFSYRNCEKIRLVILNH